MKTKSRSLFVALMLACFSLLNLATPRSVWAVTLLDDQFSDGSRFKTGALDGNWYVNSSDASLSVISNELNYTSGANFAAAAGVLPVSGYLANNGDFIQLSFNFRFVGTPADQASGFRFGFYNSNGTAVTADNGTNVFSNSPTSNDYGYYFNVSTGTTKSHQLWRETGLTDGMLGGTDRVQIGATETTLNGIADTSTHAAIFRLVRTSATTIEISAQIDSTIYFNNVSTSSLTPSLIFNEVGFSIAGNSNSVRVDNMLVTATVPEPTTIGLALCGLATFGLGMARRRIGHP